MKVKLYKTRPGVSVYMLLFIYKYLSLIYLVFRTYDKSIVYVFLLTILQLYVIYTL